MQGPDFKDANLLSRVEKSRQMLAAGSAQNLLLVGVLSAKELTKVDMVSGCDPFVRLSIGRNRAEKTPTVRRSVSRRLLSLHVTKIDENGRKK